MSGMDDFTEPLPALVITPLTRSKKKYEGRVVVADNHAPAGVTTHRWDSDSPSDIVAWWLQGMPSGGPTLLGGGERPDVPRVPFTESDLALVRNAVMERRAQLDALLAKPEGKA